MKTLYLIRHGQTEWNRERRMQGRLDSPLTAAGRGQADVHARCIKAAGPVDLLLVSPSGRTRETAYILNSHLGAALEYDELLMERDCGHWSGMTLEEIEASFPEDWQQRQQDPYYHRPPAGENHQDAQDRVRELLESLYELDLDTIGLVTHGIMSRVILAHFLQLSPVEASRVRHPNELLYRLDFRATRIDVSHYLSGEGPHAGLLHHQPDGTIARPERFAERPVGSASLEDPPMEGDTPD